jgi:hypothetical protein
MRRERGRTDPPWVGAACTARFRRPATLSHPRRHLPGPRGRPMSSTLPRVSRGPTRAGLGWWFAGAGSPLQSAL